MNERGKITHRARAAQVVDYSGLAIGGATFTDIDGAFEVDGKAFAFLELKYLDAPVQYGQRLFLARTVDALSGRGLAAVGILARHDVHDCASDIPAHKARVDKLRWRGKWLSITSGATVGEVVERFFKKHAPQGYRRLVNGATASQDAPQSTNAGAGAIPGSETETLLQGKSGADAPKHEGF